MIIRPNLIMSSLLVHIAFLVNRVADILWMFFPLIPIRNELRPQSERIVNCTGAFSNLLNKAGDLKFLSEKILCHLVRSLLKITHRVGTPCCEWGVQSWMLVVCSKFGIPVARLQHQSALLIDSGTPFQQSLLLLPIHTSPYTVWLGVCFLPK